MVFKAKKMINGDNVKMFDERMKAEQNKVYKFLGCKQGDKIDVNVSRTDI